MVIENSLINLSLKKIILAVITIIVFKLLFLTVLVYQHYEIDPENFVRFTFITKDYNYFLKPVEYFYKIGIISYDGVSNFAGRLPGYWLPYLLIRFFFTKKTSITLLIIFQIILSIISNFLFSLMVYRKTKNELLFWITILICSTNFFLLPFEYMTMTESLSVSTSVIGFYYFDKFYTNYRFNINYLMISGFMLAWMMFLRPFLIGFYCIPILILLFKKEFKYVILFVIPIVTMEVCWVTRNYLIMDKIIITVTPANESYNKIYSKSWLQIRKLIRSWGEETAYFEENSLAQWFRRKNDDRDIEKILPKYILNNVNYTKNQILDLRLKYIKFINDPTLKDNSIIDLEIAETARNYRLEYIKNNYIRHQYNLWSNLKFMFFRSGTSYLSISKNKKALYFIIKTYGLIYYYIFTVLGFFFILKGLINKNRNYYPISFSIISFLLLFIYCFDVNEPRYFLVPFTVLIYCSIINFDNIELKNKFSKL